LRDEEFENTLDRVDMAAEILEDWMLLRRHPKYKKSVKSLPRFKKATDWDRKFDPWMPQPPSSTGIRNFLFNHWGQLALGSMVHWTAANTFLGYIRHASQPRPLDRDLYYEFLTFCQSRGTLFEFRRFGTGLVRRIDAGWPAPLLEDAQRVSAIPEPPAPKEELVQKILLAHGPEMFQRGYSRDSSGPLFFLWWKVGLQAWNVERVLEGHPMDDVTVPELNTVFRSFSRKKKLLV
jgi:hypothetical protein